MALVLAVVVVVAEGVVLEGIRHCASTKTRAASAMVGGTCNNQSKGAVEERRASATLTGIGEDCNNGSGNDGIGDDDHGDTDGGSGSDGESVVAMGWSHGGTILL